MRCDPLDWLVSGDFEACLQSASAEVDHLDHLNHISSRCAFHAGNIFYDIDHFDPGSEGNAV